jgi:hypothetical protein
VNAAGSLSGTLLAHFIAVVTHRIQEPDAALGHAHHWIVATAAAPARLHPFNHPDLLLIQSYILFA